MYVLITYKKLTPVRFESFRKHAYLQEAVQKSKDECSESYRLLFELPKHFRFPQDHNIMKDAKSAYMSYNECKECIIRRRGKQLKFIDGDS